MSNGRFGGGIFCSTSTYGVKKTMRLRKDDKVQLLREETELEVQKGERMVVKRIGLGLPWRSSG